MQAYFAEHDPNHHLRATDYTVLTNKSFVTISRPYYETLRQELRNEEITSKLTQYGLAGEGSKDKFEIFTKAANTGTPTNTERVTKQIWSNMRHFPLSFLIDSSVFSTLFKYILPKDLIRFFPILSQTCSPGQRQGFVSNMGINYFFPSLLKLTFSKNSSYTYEEIYRNLSPEVQKLIPSLFAHWLASAYPYDSYLNWNNQFLFETMKQPEQFLSLQENLKKFISSPAIPFSEREEMIIQLYRNIFPIFEQNGLFFEAKKEFLKSFINNLNEKDRKKFRQNPEFKRIFEKIDSLYPLDFDITDFSVINP